jgi:hypothetical protein
MEGKFSSEGLQAIDGDDDMLTAMARELVENKGIGESADSVWRGVQQLRPSSQLVAKEKPIEIPMEVDYARFSKGQPLTLDVAPTSPLVETTNLSQPSPIRSSESGQLSLF